MAKGKELDNLTQQAMAAAAAGMSYGKYKGLQYEKIQQGKIQAPEIPCKKTPTSTRMTFDLICEQCGVAFVGRSRHRKYCSEECKNKHDRQVCRERRLQAQNEEHAATQPLNDLPPIGGYHDY